MRRASRWANGWAGLGSRDELPEYAALGRFGRLRADVRSLLRAIATPGFLFAALVFTAALLATQIVAWRFDLTGSRRDGMLVLPALLVAPWVAAARRRHLASLLAPENAITVRPDAADHSGRSWGTEQQWRPSLTKSTGAAGSVSPGSTSSWRSRASARWRRSRSRASAK
jgi:hypothetical protein